MHKHCCDFFWISSTFSQFSLNFSFSFVFLILSFFHYPNASPLHTKHQLFARLSVHQDASIFVAGKLVPADRKQNDWFKQRFDAKTDATFHLLLFACENFSSLRKSGLASQLAALLRGNKLKKRETHVGKAGITSTAFALVSTTCWRASTRNSSSPQGELTVARIRTVSRDPFKMGGEIAQPFGVQNVAFPSEKRNPVTTQSRSRQRTRPRGFELTRVELFSRSWLLMGPCPCCMSSCVLIKS